MYDYTCKSCTHEFDYDDCKIAEVGIIIMCPVCESIEINFNNENELF